MSGRFLGDGPPSALQCMERIYGFLATSERGNILMPEWQKAREGLATVADYHQVVSRLASLACQLVDVQPGDVRNRMSSELMQLVQKLQNVSPDL
jgi:hypothetical protein